MNFNQGNENCVSSSSATVLSSVLSGCSAFTHVSVSAFVQATTSDSVSGNVQTMPQRLLLQAFCQPSYAPPLPAWRLASSAANLTSVSVSQTLTAFTSASLSAILLADVLASTTGRVQTGVSAFSSCSVSLDVLAFNGRILSACLWTYALALTSLVSHQPFQNSPRQVSASVYTGAKSSI